MTAATLMLTSCDHDGDDEPQPVPNRGHIAIASAVSTDAADPLGALSETVESKRRRERKVLEDAAALGPMLNEFWTAQLSPDMTFDEPDRFEYYRRQGGSLCGGAPGPGPNNAYYCSEDSDEHVGFDIEWLQQFLERHPGGATTFLIIAHEWGHAVHDTWLENGAANREGPRYRRELNADCLAGVFLAASIRDGMVVEEAGDADAIFRMLYEGGSYSSPWLDPGDHGTPAQRQQAFRDGYVNSTSYCREKY